MDGDAQARLKALVEALNGRRALSICMHNNPDPDGIACAYALKELAWKVAGARSRLYYGGLISRASNRALLSQCRIELTRARAVTGSRATALALVDAQPGGSNTIIPRGTRVDVVLDHHNIGRGLRREPLGHVDIRPQYGSCAAILTEYLRAAGITPDKRLATALFYGVRTDVWEMSRGRAEEDLAALEHLFPFSSQKLLKRIESPRLPRAYYRMILRGLRDATVYRDVVITHLGGDCEPDIVGELADLMIRMAGMRWSFVCGIHEKSLLFSIRTTHRAHRAGDLAIRLVGRAGSAGGHNSSAGGRVELKEFRGPGGEPFDQPEAVLADRFLTALRRKDVQPQPVRLTETYPFPSLG